MRKQWGVAPDAIVAGFVGRFTPQKDPVRFSEALSMARDRVPNLVGVMMGDGELRAAIETAGDAEALRMPGWVDARVALSGLDMLVMTSRYEAMPYSLLEALSAGLPILSTEVGGVDETVIDGENGRRFANTASSAEIANVLVAAASDRQQLTRWGAVSRERASRYTIENMTNQTEAIYRRAIERRAAKILLTN
ncbi:glycosyltransferase family 4 protein [Roseibium sp.]|uniref:glycosyltransferase family 4 protein n=1 Tax=Roseibium sp. TaxID=1936156 RepID=UPI00260287BA|nr:glycosyltransferase family 4 protein [Roseibium sp.]